MAVDINFINLDDNNAVLGPEIDLGIENSALLDLQFDITEPEDHIGFIYRNDAKIGEFGKTETRGKYLEWYAGNGVPIYVKDGDIIKAEVQNELYLLGPGPTTVIHANVPDNVYYYGAMDNEDLINSSDLLLKSSFTQGIQFNLDFQWLKFKFDDRIIYIASKPIRHSVLYENLRWANVLDGTKTFEHKGYTFGCGLLGGMTPGGTGPITQVNTDVIPPWSVGSEWNRTLVWLSELEPTLNLMSNSINYCREEDPDRSNASVFRGYYGIRSGGYVTKDGSATSAKVWRPMLTLM